VGWKKAIRVALSPREIWFADFGIRYLAHRIGQLPDYTLNSIRRYLITMDTTAHQTLKIYT